MTLSLTFACLWFVLAGGIAMLPSKRSHWPQAYGLIAVGLPLLAWVWVENGPWIALLVLVAAASVLRWPVIYLLRWVRRGLGGRTGAGQE